MRDAIVNALRHALLSPQRGSRCCELTEELLNNDEVEVFWVDESLHRAAIQFLKARPDKTYSLCDAVSFVLMRQLDIDEALTTDKHFEQEGFKRLLGSE